MKIILIIQIIYLLVQLLVGCKSPNDNNPPPYEEFDLIQNYSFEQNNVPTIEGWRVETNLTETVTYSDDVPPLGGSYSVVLSVSDRGFTRLRTVVYPSVGEHRLKLSFWAKSINQSGLVSYFLNQTKRRTITITDSSWLFYETLDTIKTTVGDSLIVELDAGITYTFAQSYFDMCRLRIVK